MKQMTTKTRRFLALLMTVFMCFTIQLPTFAAEADATVFDFEDGSLAKLTDTSNYDPVESFSIHTWEEGTDDEIWGKSLKYKNRAGKNEAIQIGSIGGGTYNLFAVEYSIRIDKASSTFNTDFRHSGGDLYVMKMDSSLNVVLCDTVVTQYELEKWYDIKIWYDTPKKEALLLMKESSASEWNIYGAKFGSATDNGTEKLFFEFHDGSDEEDVKYIDNLKFFPYTESEKANLMLSNLRDDFESGIGSSWETTNVDFETSDLAAEPLDGYDGNVMKLKDISEDTSDVQLAVGKYPFTDLTVPDARQRVAFKIGSNFDEGSAGVKMNFKDPETGTLSEVNLLTLAEETVVMGDASEGVVFEDANIEPGKLYDAELIYDATTSTAAFSLTGENGDIYSSYLDMGLFDGEYGSISSVEFVCQSTAQNEVYVDDFVWELHDVDFEYEDYIIKSGREHDADINETVIFKFTDAIASDNIPAVEITKDGKAVNEECTVEAKGKTVQVTFEELEKDSDYTVEVFGAQCVFGGEADSGVAEFTTADYTVKTEMISVDEGTITANLKSAYNGGIEAYVAASAYDGDDNLTQVKLLPVEVPYRETESVTFIPEFEEEYSYIKAMVIKNFESAIHYSSNVPSDMESDSDEETDEECEAITSVETDGDTFTVYGKNISKKDSIISIQVLNPDKTWTDLEGFDYENGDITQILSGIDSVAGVEYAGSYSFTQKITGDEIPPFRIRFGDGKISYYDRDLMESINAASSAQELEEISKGNVAVWDDMKSYVEDLSEEEQPVFWQILFETKEALSQEGTPFEFPSQFSAKAPGVSVLARLNLASDKSVLKTLFADFRNERILTGNSYDIYAGEGDFDEYGMSESQKSSFLTYIYSNINDYEYIEDFITDFNENALFYAIKGAPKAAVDAIISNSDLIDSDEIPTYFELSSTKKSNVCKKIGANDRYKSIEALLSAIESAAKSEKRAKEESAGGGGGGGGGNTQFKGEPFVSVFEEDKTKEENVTFTDIANVDWAKTAINALADKNIVSGDGKGSFRPNDFVTREEFVKMLVLTLNISTSFADENFDDITSSDWCRPYVAAAISKGIVNGIDENNFGKGRIITREEMATMTYRALSAMGIMLGGADKDEFADMNSISDWAKEACVKMQEAGIINGMGQNHFAPKENVTRAQAAKILYEVLSR
ncbi:MAG: S-layer homology domain-containing protein [Ruminococcaceae bacterium]|nr:S-layer homology domain-containing protein [Oscillospiraceae bacterium]